MRGTHQGTFMGIGATEIGVTFTGIWSLIWRRASSANSGSASIRLGYCARSAVSLRSDRRSASTQGSAMYDAIIVGARCAGAPTAMLLARRGHRVLLVDRAELPSDTISTHWIGYDGLVRLQRWGLLERVAATGCPPTRWRVIERSGVRVAAASQRVTDCRAATRRGLSTTGSARMCSFQPCPTPSAACSRPWPRTRRRRIDLWGSAPAPSLAEFEAGAPADVRRLLEDADPRG
jgi:hypothetical protein